MILESSAIAIRGAAFLVPGALGVQEGGFILLSNLLGIPGEIALALSLVPRVRELALGIPGLAAWQLVEARAPVAEPGTLKCAPITLLNRLIELSKTPAPIPFS